MTTVMIVDDSLFMRNYLENIVKNHGYQVVAKAEDGCQAIELYKQWKPEFILLDITMPCKNGMDTLKTIMQLNRNAKVIMCSALGQQHLIIESIRIGAKDFVVKPFFRNLISTLKKHA